MKVLGQKERGGGRQTPPPTACLGFSASGKVMQGPYRYKLIGKKSETLFNVLYLDPNFEEEKNPAGLIK